MPRRRSLAWSQLSAYARAIGTELYRVHCNDGTEIRVPPKDWKTALARSLEIDGPDRPPFAKALDAMVAAGVLIVSDGVVTLLYTDAQLDAHRKRAATTPESDPPHDGGTPTARPTHDGVTPPTRSGHDVGTASPRSELSTRNHSPPVAQIDREKDREKERARACARAGWPTLEAQLQEEQPRVSPVSVVADLLAEATGGARWPVDRLHAELLELARKPLGELGQVLDALSRDPWVREQPMRASPRYVLERWNHYAQRPKPPALTRPLLPNPGEVPAPEDPPPEVHDFLQRRRRRTA